MINISKIERTPRCDLGEGIYWDVKNLSFWFVDILNFTLYKYHIYNHNVNSWRFEEEISWVLPVENQNCVLLGMASGVSLFDYEKPHQKTLLIDSFPADINQRLNDVGVDSLGRVWFGSLHKKDESLPIGKLASFDLINGLVLHDNNYKVTNGPIISYDGKFLYHNDSFENTIYRYDLNLERGTISNRSVFCRFRVEEGYPDGMCFDQDGNILVAMWGAGAIWHIDTEANMLNIWELPVPNVTNICFGGKKLDRLFVTTARKGLSKKQLEQYPDSGCLFEIIGANLIGLLPNEQKIVV